MFESEAKKRQVEAGKLFGTNHPKEVTEIIPEALNASKKSKKKNSGESRQKAAKKLNTNSHYVSDAKK